MARLFTNGGAHFVDYGSASDLDNLAAFTYAAWIRPASFPVGELIIVDKATGALVRELYATNATASFGCYVDRVTTDTDQLAAANTLVANTWHFVAWVWDGTISRLYEAQRGEALTEVAYVTNIVGSGAGEDTAAASLTLGGRSGDTTITFDGRIGRAWVYRVVLTVGELQNLMTGRWIRSNDCLIYSLLGRGSPEPNYAPGWSNAARTGTVTGTSLAAGAPLSPPFGADAAVLVAVTAAPAAPGPTLRTVRSALRW